MDYKILTIIVLSIMLIMSLGWNIILTKKIERLRDADIIDDITPDGKFLEREEIGTCEIIYL